MITKNLRRELRRSVLFSLGVSMAGLAIDTVALGINAIVFTRNAVRAATAIVYDAAAELRGRR